MASKIEICNHALLKLGQPAIMSIDDDTPRARQCFQEFDVALGAVLRAYPWPFAIVRKVLPRSVHVPEFGYSYYYVLPPDLARVVEIFPKEAEFKIEGKNLATNAETIAMRYVSKDVPVEYLDDQVAEVVALSLASRLAIIITENIQLKEMLHAETELALKQARNTWAVEDYPQEVIEGNWLAVRERGGPKEAIKHSWNPWGPDGTGVSG